MLIVISFFVKKCLKNDKQYVNILPIINDDDRLDILEKYFVNDNSDYLKRYININQDIAIIENFSSGSNAKTILCSKNGKNFYRKISFGNDAQKLYDQIKWIHKYENDLTLTKISNEFFKDDICFYDMPYIDNTVTCFNYVHTTTFDNAWKTIFKCFEDIKVNLHNKNIRNSDRETIKKYIDDKVLKNIEKIENSGFIKPLLKYDYININGKQYHNLKYYKKYLNYKYLNSIFENDKYSDIHGDLTIENIVCRTDNNSYYIIDPNTGNIHNSPYLDYAKFLQSIHGGYEFLMNTKNVIYYKNNIEFLFVKSSTYYKLYDKFISYLKDIFGMEGLKSIYFHEVIHWLRLLPYKISKDGERCLLFYAGLIMVLDDIERIIGNESSNI